MTQPTNSVIILMADDDMDDCLLTKRAMTEACIINELRFVGDGEELMEYLLQEGRYVDPESAPAPSLILLDLNMPRKDGREALQEIKSHPNLQQIPVVVMTTSREEEDVYRSYNLGANSFITKPITFDRMVDLMRTLGTYWIEFVELPRSHRRN